MATNKATATTGPHTGKVIETDVAVTAFPVYRHADPFEHDGKPYTRTVGVYNFAANAWTYTPVNQA